MPWMITSRKRTNTITSIYKAFISGSRRFTRMDNTGVAIQISFDEEADKRGCSCVGSKYVLSSVWEEQETFSKISETTWWNVRLSSNQAWCRIGNCVTEDTVIVSRIRKNPGMRINFWCMKIFTCNLLGELKTHATKDMETVLLISVPAINCQFSISFIKFCKF